ncbi:MAG: hypothetical protein Q8L48_34035 [Archangium sp.]|nr:hypothetical protein [Archangium sp.]
MHKPLKRQGDRGAPAMAGLLLYVIVSTPLQGCLFPQDEDVFPELPPKRNSPLQIRAQTPELRTTFYNSTMCQSLNKAFTLTVEDEDTVDVVSSIWFIGETTTQPFIPTSVPGGSKIRSVTAPSSLGFRSALANLTSGSTQTLTVFVADTLFQEVLGGNVEVQQREERLVDGVLLRDVGYKDSFTWVLDVEPCP